MNDNKIFKDLKNYYLRIYSIIWNRLSVVKKLGLDIENSVEVQNKKFFKNSPQNYQIISINIENSDTEAFNTILKNIDPFEVRDRADSYYYIKAFGNILYWAEKVLLYQNDDTKSIYSILNTDERKLDVLFNFDDVSVCVNFQESAINLPNKSNDNPLSFMSDDDETFATFIEITILRNFGYNISNSFKSILGSNDFNLHDDDITMLDLIENKICEGMIKTLHDIEQHIISNCCGIKNDLGIEDLKNGITVRG